MNWAIAAHISPKNGCIHNSKFPSAGNVHGNKNYTFPQCKYCLHIADFHQPSVMPLALAICDQEVNKRILAVPHKVREEVSDKEMWNHSEPRNVRVSLPRRADE
jgi:hypothetical protein